MDLQLINLTVTVMNLLLTSVSVVIHWKNCQVLYGDIILSLLVCADMVMRMRELRLLVGGDVTFLGGLSILA